MYLLCSDWSIRSLEKEEKEEEEEKENCHMLITARCTNEGRDKKLKALAAPDFVWRSSKVSGPSIFFNFSFINFEADFFRAFGLDF